MSGKPKKRPDISNGMKYRSLKLHAKVLVQCLSCVREVARMEAKGMKLEGDKFLTWHKLDDIQFDHVWELADGGKHGPKHLRPTCKVCHLSKSKRSESMRHHLARAGEKHRGEFVKKWSKPLKSQNTLRPHPTKKRTVGGRVVDRA